MNAHSTYEALRHFADGWGLLAMFVTFILLVGWPFRPGAKNRNQEAAYLIFKDENDGE